QARPPGAVQARDVLRILGDAVDEGLAQATIDEAVAELDPASGDLLRAVWAGGRLTLVAHHLCVDAVSWSIILDDLAAAWDAVRAGRRPELAPVRTSFQSWTRRLHEAARGSDRDATAAELAFWRRVTEPAPGLAPPRPGRHRGTALASGSMTTTLPLDTS